MTDVQPEAEPAMEAGSFNSSANPVDQNAGDPADANLAPASGNGGYAQGQPAQVLAQNAQYTNQQQGQDYGPQQQAAPIERQAPYQGDQNYDDQQAANMTLSALRNSPHVIAAAVFTSGGELFASYTRPGSASVAIIPRLGLGQRSGSSISTHRWLSLCQQERDARTSGQEKFSCDNFIPPFAARLFESVVQGGVRDH